MKKLRLKSHLLKILKSGGTYSDKALWRMFNLHHTLAEVREALEELETAGRITFIRRYKINEK